jgi:hypothetical protein
MEIRRQNTFSELISQQFAAWIARIQPALFVPQITGLPDQIRPLTKTIMKILFKINAHP